MKEKYLAGFTFGDFLLTGAKKVAGDFLSKNWPRA
jgi:hypothetical protein